jgi:hypothetical protein
MTDTGALAQGRVARAAGGERGFVTREIAGELLIVPVSGRVGDLEAIFTLNPVGSRIWQLLEQPQRVHDLVEAVTREYEVGNAEAASDVAEFLDALDRVGLIRRQDGRTGQPPPGPAHPGAA